MVEQKRDHPPHSIHYAFNQVIRVDHTNRRERSAEPLFGRVAHFELDVCFTWGDLSIRVHPVDSRIDNTKQLSETIHWIADQIEKGEIKTWLNGNAS